MTRPRPVRLHTGGGALRGPPRESAGDRVAEELLRVCEAVVLHGTVTEGEASALRHWTLSHPDAVRRYPGGVLADRLQRIFADGWVALDERAELGHLLRDLTAAREVPAPPGIGAADGFLDVPLPAGRFDGQEYVFAGHLLYARRADCARAVIDRGGRVSPHLTWSTSFVVVGLVASSAWLPAIQATTLRTAARLRAAGAAIHVIPEDHWILALETGG